MNLRDRQYHSSTLGAALCVLAFLLTPARGGIEFAAVFNGTAGGSATNGSAVQADLAMGGILGLSTNAGGRMAAKLGFSGQLLDLAAVRVTASPGSVDELSSRQLSHTGEYDDGSFGRLAGTAAWSILSGPLASVSTGGLVTADAVYADTAAVAGASFAGITGTVQLTVLNTGSDDYGMYAGDGIADNWQVDYFGIDNTNAVAGISPDGDDMSNLQEYLADTVPTNPDSVLMIADISVVGALVAIDWQGGVLSTQWLERCTNLAVETPAWTAIFTNVPPTAPVTNFVDTIVPGTACFYRIRAVRQ